MANGNFKRTPQALTFKRISSSLDPLNWGLHILALVLPLSVNAQPIVDFGASYPVTLKDIGNGDRLVACRRPFGSQQTDSVYLETALAGSDWGLTPIATKRLDAPEYWSFISTTATVDGLIMNGRLIVPGNSRASLVRLTDEGEFTWCNKYDGMGSGWFGTVFPSEDSIVAFANAGSLLHRVVIGPDGTVQGSIGITDTQNQQWGITTGCATDTPSEYVVAGATSWEEVWHAVIARIGLTGALWIRKYYVPIPIPGILGSSGVSRIVRAQGGGLTCTINAADTYIPGLSNSAFLMHLDDDGNVLWCRGFSFQNPGIGMRDLIQLENGDYLAIRSYDLFDDEIYRFSPAGELIGFSNCQPSCHMPGLGDFTGTAFPGRYITSGHQIAELGEYGVPCGRSYQIAGGGPSFVTPTTIQLTPILVASPTITAVPIPLADRPLELSVAISCATTPVPSVSNVRDHLRALPVPSNGSVLLKFGSEPAPPRAVELRDVQGRVVMHGFAPGEVDITSLKPGIYDCSVVGTSLHTRIVRE